MEDTLLLNHTHTYLTVAPPAGFSAPVSVLLAVGDTITVPGKGLFLILEASSEETWHADGSTVGYWAYKVKPIGSA